MNPKGAEDIWFSQNLSRGEKLAIPNSTVAFDRRRFVGQRSRYFCKKMRNKPIIVQKYGGACLETPAKIRAVASSLADLLSRGHHVVAIVSAMGKTTID
jgi:amino acid kinase family protein